MVKVVVKDSYLNFGGVHYFRGHAEEVEIGSYGEKRVPLTQMNYLDVKDRVPAPKLDIATSTIVDIDTTVLSQTDLNGGVSAIVKGVPVKFSGDAAFEKLKNQELKLVKFSMLSNAMKDAINRSPKVLADLKNYGKDARIAHEVFVIMEANLATKFNNSGTAQLSVGVKGLEATIGGQNTTSGETTVQISQDTGFGYLLLKIDWNKDKTQIADLDIDQAGLS